VDGVRHRYQQERDVEKNHILADAGYVPLHFTAKDVRNNRTKCIKAILRIYYGSHKI
jgi:very-short-patch-repair endonuclease